MLAPDQRQLFLDALHPPEGYHFDRGIGTTFTLDLTTLLITPLSLALLDVADTEVALRDPILLLEGVRRYASRLTLFCQAGRIAIPHQDNVLYRFLEPMVVEVQSPGKGVFHPKVWLLRYLAEKSSAPPLYRLLSLSRNLTFDKSWDLMVRLEGEVQARRYAYGCNNPLGDFVKALPGLAIHPIASRITEAIEVLQHEVRRVMFQVPEAFDPDKLAFYPSGIRGYRRGSVFDEGYSRAMVMSPFLGDVMLQRITQSGTDHVLISRVDSLITLNPLTLSRFKSYVLDDNHFTLEQEEVDFMADTGEAVLGQRTEPSGLHAKLFVLESGWDATWLIGSANATTAAFDGNNVEFMVGLQGRRKQVGIDKVLGNGDDSNTLRALLKSYTPPTGAVEIDENARRAEALAERVRAWLIDLDMRMEVSIKDNDCFDLDLRIQRDDQAAPRQTYTLKCWPVSLRSESGRLIDRKRLAAPITFSNLSLLALTPFIAFEIVAQVGDGKHLLRFVLKLPISGIPENRDTYLINTIISDRERFLRYLWLILAEENQTWPQWMDMVSADKNKGRRAVSRDGELPLLEVLLRALSRSPEKIQRIAEVVGQLQHTFEGVSVLPHNFSAFWEVVLEAQEKFK